MTGYSETMDKTKYQTLLDNFEEKWDTELSLHFDQKEIDSTNAQLRKSRRLLNEATTTEECKVVESRIRKLSDWIRYNFGENE